MAVNFKRRRGSRCWGALPPGHAPCGSPMQPRLEPGYDAGQASRHCGRSLSDRTPLVLFDNIEEVLVDSVNARCR